MAKGVYFIEPNKSLVSDFEGYFLLNGSLQLCGCNGILSEAIKEIQINPLINIIIIAQKLVDGDCIQALKQLSTSSALKIVTIDSPNELLQQQINDLGGKIVIKPYSFSDIDNVIFNSANEQNTSEQDSADGPCDITDNPFINAVMQGTSVQHMDVKEKLRQVRKEKPASQTNHLIPQQVIAVHNQKGGVGKTTIAKELAIAISRFKIIKNGEPYQPKVCLCDFDLDASDVVSVLNLPSSPNIGTWYNDLKIEAKRVSTVKGVEEPLTNIRFTEKQITENYLLRHETGIYVLAAPETKRESTEIHSEDISAIINNLRACSFDIIILDTGPNILDYTLTALIEADTILAVSTCEIVSARRLHSIIQDLIKVPGCNPSKIKLVVNMHDGNSNIAPDELVDVLNLELVGVIPKFDEIGNINNEAYSVFYNKVAKDKKTNIVYAESVNKLAKRITHMDEIIAQQNPKQQSQPYNLPESQSRKSFWQRLFGR